MSEFTEHHAACLTDLAVAAEGVLPRDVWAFVEGGAGDELAMHGNTTALRELRLVPRTLTGSRQRRLGTRLFGADQDLPVAVAPMAYQRLVHASGESGTAWAASQHRIPLVVPMLSSVSVEELATFPAALWFQLYWLRDRDRMYRLIRRAEQSGARALMLTVDMPVMGRRLRDLRHSFTLPAGIQAAHFADEASAVPFERRNGASAVAAHTSAAFDATLSWGDLAWLTARTELPVLLKGILHPKDAVRAVEAGAAGVVVSNHGGRQFDRAVSSVMVLPHVREAVGDDALVMVDSGFRSGSDVLAALALGADCVLLGRPVLWGLATGGGSGVRRVLDILAAELDNAMALTGCADITAAREIDVIHGTAAFQPTTPGRW